MRLSVGQYHGMIASGILNDNMPVELLEGFLITKMPQNPPHRVTTRFLRILLDRLLASYGCYVEMQAPITLADSEPEPDLTVVQGDPHQFLDRHPGTNDIPLVIEVSDATLTRDRRSKKRIYAQAGIASYWIVNLVARQIEVYTAPGEVDGTVTYQSRQDYRRGETIPVILDGVEIGQVAVNEVLP